MDKIESLLWVQHQNPTQNGYLIMNGNLVPFSDKEKYDFANKIILKVYSTSPFDSHLVKRYLESSGNKYFQLGSSLLSGIAYKSCFTEKDENGKSIPFMFWKSNSRLNDFIRQVNESALQVNKTINAEELAFMEQLIKRIRCRKIVGFILIFIVLLSISMI